jgi:hypothetical protein
MDVRFEQRVNIKFKHKVTVFPHPPYSPDLSPCDFCLFLRLKKGLKGRRHENIEAIQAAATMELTGIPKETFTRCFQDFRNAGNSVLTAEGTTWEGTGSIICEVEFCIFYRLSLRTLRTRDVFYVDTVSLRSVFLCITCCFLIFYPLHY